MIEDAMATTMILKRYNDGTYVGNFWEKSRHGKGLLNLASFEINFPPYWFFLRNLPV
jgi:hypothetical protein